MQDGNASRALIGRRHGIRVSPLALAWNRGARWQRVRSRLRAIAAHPRLGDIVLVGITLGLVGVLLATVERALEVSQLRTGWAFGFGLQ